jgi:uncharacterized membrane protein
MDGSSWVWIVAIITVGIGWLAFVFSMHRSSNGSKDLPPVEALKLRFAKGQITEADFLRSMAILESDRLLELSD